MTTRSKCLPLVLGLLLALASSDVLVAAETTAEGSSASGLPSVDAGANRTGRSLDDYVPVLPERPPNAAAASNDTQKAYEKAMIAYYTYRQRGFQQRLDAFEWQAASSKVIFVVVLVLVFTGIGFAAIQFRAGMRGKKEDAALDTEFAVDVKGIRVRSPVLGVIVLTISLAFFYLYLAFVYPIVNVF